MGENSEFVTRIAARPGTAEYDAQFQQQSQSAIDAAIRMPLCRFVFGLFAIVNVVAICDDVVTGRFQTLCLIPILIESLSIASTGKSRCFGKLWVPHNSK